MSHLLKSTQRQPSRRSRLSPKSLAFAALLFAGALAGATPSGRAAADEPPAATTAPLLTPIPPAWELAFSQVATDPRPPAIIRDTHYIVSNEDNHYVWQSALTGRGGVFVGVGTDQNYLMAGWARPEMLVLLDFDQLVVDLHRVYRMLFLNAPTPQDFLDLWDERNVRRVEEMINGLQTDAPTRAGMLRAYRTSHYSVPRRLRKIDAMYRPLGVRWFLNDIGQYRYLVELFRSGRAIIVRGDLSVGGSLASIGAAAQRAGAIVRVVYLSNAERYFPYTAGFRKSILALPVDAKSVVLRTRARMNGSYEYIVQETANFQRWLAWGKMSYAVEMTRYREPESTSSLAYVIRRLPPSSDSPAGAPRIAPPPSPVRRPPPAPTESAQRTTPVPPPPPPPIRPAVPPPAPTAPAAPPVVPGTAQAEPYYDEE